MSKISELEESVDYFLQESKNDYCLKLEKENYEYLHLQNKIHGFLEKLLKDKENKFELEDMFFEWMYEVMHIEGMYLYKQGFKDCYKIIQLLERD